MPETTRSEVSETAAQGGRPAGRPVTTARVKRVVRKREGRALYERQTLLMPRDVVAYDAVGNDERPAISSL